MASGRLIEKLRRTLTDNPSRTVAWVGFALWIACLHHGGMSLLWAMVSMPLGIALLAVGPLEGLPARWKMFNWFVNAMTTMAFVLSIMFAIAAVSFELPWGKSGRTVFLLGGWAVEIALLHALRPRMRRSMLYRLSEDRRVYTPMDDDRR
ncbi:hypothetical protein [Pseudomonas sp. UBA6562]|uniref:hypothetical protein n=1 Tax=Pseudomonas sp. UBA6562 TaxID=1947332 RepID=UPI0025FC121D|nr:hypothetical protein [Pseudomonas sp. UBA6562]